MTVMGNVGSAMSMASTGLIVLGAAAPLGILKEMQRANDEPVKQRKKRKSTTKKTTKKSKRK